MILFIALSYAELGTLFPLSGGVVRIPHISFGGFASFLTCWINWLAASALPPIEVEGHCNTPRSMRHLPKKTRLGTRLFTRPRRWVLSRP